MNDPKQRWIVLALLFLAATLNYADRTALSAVFPLVKADLGMSDFELGAIGSLFLWSYGLMSPFSGMLGDRFSRTSLVITSLLAWSLITCVTGLVMTAQQMFAARICLGLAEALYLPAAMALIAQYFTSKGRGRALSVHVVGLQTGFVLGGYVAGYLGDRSGWRASLFALGGAGLVLTVCCRLLLRKDDPHAAGAGETKVTAKLPWREGFRLLLSVKSYYFLALEAALTSIGAWIFGYWLPLYYSETFHLSLTEAGVYGTAALSAGTWAGIVCGGWLSDQVTAKKGARNRMLIQCTCYALSAPFLLSFVWSNSLHWITACVAIFGLLQALGASNAPPLWFDVLQKPVWARGVAVMNTTNCLMGGLGITAAGFLKSQLGLKRVFAGLSVIMVVTALLLFVCYLFFLEKDLRRRAEQAAAA